MSRTYINRFLLFFIILATCVSMLLYYIIAGDRELVRIGSYVMQSQENMNQAKFLGSTINRMITYHRSYMITQRQTFLEKYLNEKDRAEKIVDYFEARKETNNSVNTDIFAEQVEKSYQSLLNAFLFNREDTGAATLTLEKIQRVDTVNAQIQKIISDYVGEQYLFFRQNIKTLDARKRQYIKTLMVGVAGGALVILILNSFLLRVQSKHEQTRASLKDSEKRFRLAIEGTQDGIYDWDVKNDQVFYSRRFFEMLGYNRNFQIGSVEILNELVHPDDKDRVWQTVEKYFAHQIPDYRLEIRLRHSDGHWLWVQSRAKALFDDKGSPYRMVGAHTDISHLKKEQEKLQQEKARAVEENEAKREFLAHMSHEIRTPLTAISGIAEILEKSKSSFSEKQQKLLETLRNSTSSLKDLISDVLDFSKIENGDLELINNPFELMSLLDAIMNMLQIKAQEKGVNFQFNSDIESHQIFYGDEGRLRQIFVNLIDNAIKFTEKDGSVSVRAHNVMVEDKVFLKVEVEDTGIGIDEEYFDQIFDRFKQVDTSESRKHGGTGLGLSISRHLANLMDGDIELKSKKGQGSVFVVTLPYKNTVFDGARKSERKVINIDEKIKELVTPDTKVLIVEDYEGNVIVISYILDELGLKYDVAGTGKQALDKWRENKYDMLFMDVQMPEMDGFTATQLIREEEERDNLPFTPIIGMTAHAMVKDKSKCIEVGMDAYLPKPLVEAQLKEEIYRFLR
jgi:PAS domain S-box-containing protein